MCILLQNKILYCIDIVYNECMGIFYCLWHNTYCIVRKLVKVTIAFKIKKIDTIEKINRLGFRQVMNVNLFHRPLHHLLLYLLICPHCVDCNTILYICSVWCMVCALLDSHTLLQHMSPLTCTHMTVLS